MKIYAARDKFGFIQIGYGKPNKNYAGFWDFPCRMLVEVATYEGIFNSITTENSPKELITKDILDEVIKLADKMYYTAQQLTTDASLLHKAMDEYKMFKINNIRHEED